MNKNNPLVSVIMPTYNRKEYVIKAVDNVLSQAYKNLEIIIVDDCSNDGTKDVLLDLGQKHSQIIPLSNKTNLGPAGAANRGISQARGKYVAILDDDDIWVDDAKLEKQVEFLERNQEYVLTGGGVIKVDQSGKEINRYLPIENDIDIRRAILADNAFAHSTVLFRKDTFEKAGGYQKDFGYFADWDLWLKLGRLGKFYNFQDFFIYYLDQEHDKKRSTHDYKIRRQLLANIRLRKKYGNYYPGYPKSVILCFASYFYSFLPFRSKLRPVINKLRNLIFGPPPYKYLN